MSKKVKALSPEEKPPLSPRASPLTAPDAGTGILPMPDASEQVAGRPRRNRVFVQPGQAGAITPEDDVSDRTDKKPFNP